MGNTWGDQIVWSEPHSIHSLTHAHGARSVIPKERGYYAFVSENAKPGDENSLYIGIAVGRSGLYQRLSAYLRGTISLDKAKRMKHEGKLRLSFARIKGLDGEGSAQTNTVANDKLIHLCWAVAPFHFSGRGGAEREMAFMLERALINALRPIYNHAKWDREMDFDLDDEAF
ncbi:MAG: hypothetical protein AAF744_01525 [Pseudomonadota bacterium]